MNKKITIYSRQSHYKDGSVSHETQQELCKKQVELMGLDTNSVVVYEEAKNKSGATLDRPKLQELISDIKKGKISMVVAYRFDRLSRSLVQFAELMNLFKDYNVSFVTVQDKIDTTTPMGEMLVKILVLFAEFERESTIMRVRDAYINKAKQGHYMGGRKPYGFELVETIKNVKSSKKLEPVKSELEQIVELYNTYATEGFSLRTVLKHMLSKDMQSLQGKEWTTAKISNILRNVIYVKADKDIYDYLVARGVNFPDDLTIDDFNGEKGLQLYNIKNLGRDLGTDSDELVVMMEHQGVIDSDVWLKCQKKLEENNQIGNAVSNRVSWLGGKVFCGKCGHRMTTIKGKPTKDGTVTTYFNCIGRSEKQNCKGPGATVYINELEKTVAKSITLKLKSLKTERRVLSDENQFAVYECKRKIKIIMEQEDKFLELMMNGDFNDFAIKKFNEKIAELGKERELLQQQIDDIMAKDDILTQSIDLAEKWRKAGFQTRKTVLNALVESILIHKDGQPEIIWKI